MDCDTHKNSRVHNWRKKPDNKKNAKFYEQLFGLLIMSSPMSPPHAVEERKKHTSQPQLPAEDDAVPSTDVPPPPVAYKTIGITMQDGLMENLRDELLQRKDGDNSSITLRRVSTRRSSKKCS